MTPKAKKNLRTIGVVLAIIIFLLFAFWWAYNRNKATNTNTDTNTRIADTTVNEKTANCPTESVVGIAITGAELVALYQENAQIKAENAGLKAQLEDCLNGKKPATTTTRTNTRSSTTKKSTAPAEDKSESRSSDAGKSSASYSDNPEIAVNQYESERIGDVGNDFDANGHLCYYFKADLLKGIKDRDTREVMIEVDGQTITGSLKGNYYEFQTSTPVLVNMLDNEWRWAVYLGQHTRYHFGMYLPHEAVKLNSALENHPNIRRNGVFNEGVEGWEFVTRINYRTR